MAPRLNQRICSTDTTALREEHEGRHVYAAPEPTWMGTVVREPPPFLAPCEARDVVLRPRSSEEVQLTPVILDTDIGTDIDDTWALAMLLRSPELDLKAVVTTHGDTHYRALLVAKLLGLVDRADVPVGEGSGSQLAPSHRRQEAWLGGYGPDDYAGPVRADGARLMVETIMASPTPVTVLAIGPASTVAAALALEPEIAANARFVGMHGAVRRGYRDSATPVPEYNVFLDVTAFRSVLAAAWPITLTPLDTCGVVVLDGEDYARVRDAEDPLMQAVMANYRIWAQASGIPELPARRSSTLFDTVAVYLAFAEDLLEMETVQLEVRDDGLTFESAAGRPVRAAMRWRDLPAFRELLIRRLIANGASAS